MGPSQGLLLNFLVEVSGLHPPPTFPIINILHRCGTSLFLSPPSYAGDGTQGFTHAKLH